MKISVSRPAVPPSIKIEFDNDKQYWALLAIADWNDEVIDTIITQSSGVRFETVMDRYFETPDEFREVALPLLLRIFSAMGSDGGYE